jgi:hypothetical protein
MVQLAGAGLFILDLDKIARPHWLMNELLGDFPFQEESSRSNALAYLLTPFVRELVHGPVPMGVIEAPVAGTGKGLLANAIGIPANGHALEAIPQRDSASWQCSPGRIFPDEPANS